MGLVRIATLLTACTLLAACGDGPPRTTVQEHVHRHATEGDVLSLGATVHGDSLHVAWVEGRGDAAPVARYSRSDDGGRRWSPPETIGTGQPPPDRVQRSNDIRIASNGERLLVVWQTRGDGFADSGPMVMAERRNDGWRPLEPPATESDSRAHGFFGLSTDPDGRFHLAWLDHRDGNQGLRHARSTGADWEPTRTLDGSTCECCWNTVAHHGSRAWVLYRDRDPRDMALATSDDSGGRWRQAGPVGAFGWNVDGCPHVGGGLAVTGDDEALLHALVWTGAEPYTGVHYLKTAVANEPDWSAPRRLGERDAGNPDLAATGDGRLLAVWDAGGRIHMAWGPGNGWRESVLSADDSRASHPLALVSGHGGHVLWTERDESGRRTWTAVLVAPGS